MEMKFYVLDAGGEPVPASRSQWATWLETNEALVFNFHLDHVRVSTVFLGHAFEKKQPVLWETMVFGGRLDQVRDRCAGNTEQAQAMHNAMVQRVRNSMA